MKFSAFALVLACAAVLTAQDKDPSNGRLTMFLKGPGGGRVMAQHMTRKEYPILNLTGDVRVEWSSASMILVADEAVYHEDTGVIEPRGNVRLEPPQLLNRAKAQ